jgi:hypothetical protein
VQQPLLLVVGEPEQGNISVLKQTIGVSPGWFWSQGYPVCSAFRSAYKLVASRREVGRHISTSTVRGSWRFVV